MTNEETRAYALEEAATFCDDAADTMAFLSSHPDYGLTGQLQNDELMYRKAAAAIRARFHTFTNAYIRSSK